MAEASSKPSTPPPADTEAATSTNPVDPEQPQAKRAKPSFCHSPIAHIQYRLTTYRDKELGHKENRCVFRFELALFILCLLGLVVIIGTVCKLFTDAPFEPVFWGFVFGLVLYFTSSLVLVGLWGWSNSFKFKTLLSRVRFWLYILSLLGALVCLLLVLYFILPESFHSTEGVKLVQLRSVTTDTARVFLRDPDGCVNAKLYYRSVPSLEYTESTLLTTNCSHEVDHTSFAHLTGLQPGTQYEVMVNVSTVYSSALSFKTNPAPSTKSKFSFYFGSCFLILDRLFANDNTDAFEFLTEVLKPDLFVFLGDFVYADVPFYNTDSELKYQSLYRRSLLNSRVNKLLQSIPSYFMWDDHEVANDYPKAVTSNLFKINEYSFNRAFKLAWEVFIGGGNPDTLHPGTNTTYYTFSYGDSSFFFLDTRLYREETTILGTQQLADLYAFLSEPIDGFKFVLSPVAMTNDFYTFTKDAWTGYTEERNAILDFIETEDAVQRVVFLSGDMHFAYASQLRGKTRPNNVTKQIYEVSCSPIGAFDFTIGGAYTGRTFKPESEREDHILFETKGEVSMPSLVGIVRVDTTLQEPQIDIDLYDRRELVYTLHLNSTLLM